MTFTKGLSVILILGLFSCKSLKESINRVSTRVDTSLLKITEGFEEIKHEFVPFDTLVKKSIIAAIEGVEDEQSKNNLDSITQRFNQYLVRAIDSLHLSVRSKEIVDSLKSSLLSEDTRNEVDSLIRSSIETATGELEISIDGLIARLTSPENRDKLHSLKEGLISDDLGHDLSKVLNQAIKDLDLSPLSDKILKQVMTQEVKDTLKTILDDPVKKAEVTGEGLLGLARRYIGYVLLGILTVAATIILLIYRFRRKKDADVATLLMRKISEKGDHSVIKELKEEIKQSAEKEELESYLNQRLKKEKLL